MVTPQAATVEPTAPVVPGESPGRSRRWRLWVVVALLAAALVAQRVHGRIEEDKLRQPLRAVEQASVATHRPIGLVSPTVADRWTDGDATEDQVRARVRSGNAYLEPAFYYYAARHGGSGSWNVGPDARCYYLAVQRHGEFRAALVSAITRLCYSDGSERPYAQGWVAVQ